MMPVANSPRVPITAPRPAALTPRVPEVVEDHLLHSSTFLRFNADQRPGMRTVEGKPFTKKTFLKALSSDDTKTQADFFVDTALQQLNTDLLTTLFAESIFFSSLMHESKPTNFSLLVSGVLSIFSTPAISLMVGKLFSESGKLEGDAKEGHPSLMFVPFFGVLPTALTCGSLLAAGRPAKTAIIESLILGASTLITASINSIRNRAHKLFCKQEDAHLDAKILNMDIQGRATSPHFVKDFFIQNPKALFHIIVEILPAPYLTTYHKIKNLRHAVAQQEAEMHAQAFFNIIHKQNIFAQDSRPERIEDLKREIAELEKAYASQINNAPPILRELQSIALRLPQLISDQNSTKNIEHNGARLADINRQISELALKTMSLLTE